MNRDSLKGTGKVYSFTLRQILKSKSNLVTLIIFALIAVLAVPVASIFLSGESAPEISAVSQVYIKNETEYTPDTDSLGDYFASVRFTETQNSIDQISPLPTELYTYVRNDSSNSGISITIVKPDNATVTDADIEALRSALHDGFYEARLESLGATTAQLDIVMSGYSLNVINGDEYGSNEAGLAAAYSIQYAYAIILMIISMFTIIYIVRAVIEEKASKLVELLMVSVKPLALLIGKILAVMTYIFGMLVTVIVLFLASYAVSGAVLGNAEIVGLIDGLGIDSSILNLGPLALISVFVSLILAYLTFSILAGLSGTSCSSMDDVEGANMNVTFLMLGAYIVSIFVSSFGGPLAVVGSLVPIVSAFVAPAQYILGGIGFWTLALSWVIQLAVLMLLAVFSSRIYTGLIMYSGSRLKFKALLSMYRQHPEKEAQI